MKAKSLILIAAVVLGTFAVPTTAEAGRRDHRYVRDGSRVVVVYAPASRRTYYHQPVRYRRPYYPAPGISVRVNVR